MSQQTQPSGSDFLYEVEDSSTLLSRFQQAANWQERYRQIMLLGKDLPNLSAPLRQDCAKVQGKQRNISKRSIPTATLHNWDLKANLAPRVPTA